MGIKVILHTCIDCRLDVSVSSVLWYSLEAEMGIN